MIISNLWQKIKTDINDYWCWYTNAYALEVLHVIMLKYKYDIERISCIAHVHCHIKKISTQISTRSCTVQWVQISGQLNKNTSPTQYSYKKPNLTLIFFSWKLYTCMICKCSTCSSCFKTVLIGQIMINNLMGIYIYIYIVWRLKPFSLFQRVRANYTKLGT